MIGPLLDAATRRVRHADACVMSDSTQYVARSPHGAEAVHRETLVSHLRVEDEGRRGVASRDDRDVGALIESALASAKSGPAGRAAATAARAAAIGGERASGRGRARRPGPAGNRGGAARRASRAPAASCMPGPNARSAELMSPTRVAWAPDTTRPWSVRALGRGPGRDRPADAPAPRGGGGGSG